VTAVYWALRCPVHGDRKLPTLVPGGIPAARFTCDFRRTTPPGVACGKPLVSVYYDADGNEGDTRHTYPELLS
jgi:hypothetical protein